MERFNGVRGLLFSIQVTLFGLVFALATSSSTTAVVLAIIGMLIAVASILTVSGAAPTAQDAAGETIEG